MEIEKIPKNYLSHMEEILGKEEFLKFYEFIINNEVKKSVTFNRKANTSFIMENLPDAKKVELAEFGYFIPNDFKIGESLLNHAGVIYSQDSSAMIPVEVMDVKEGDVVLDLCSAPGGKSIQILNKLNGKGLLFSNEIEYSRAKILFENITRMGFNNCVITNSTPKDFKQSKMLFDKILVDAPCSGEGLIAKSKVIIDWKPEYIESNANRQLEILNTIKDNLKEGGTLVYSTCTFNLQENEEVVYKFLKQNPNFELIEPPKMFTEKLDKGISVYETNMDKCLRCYPHKNNGSGQFVAVMKRIGSNHVIESRLSLKRNVVQRELKLISDFLNTTLTEDDGLLDKVYKVNNTVYLLASNIKLDGVKTMCNGCVIGELTNVLKPNHSFFKQYGHNFKNAIELNESDALKYIQGLQIEVDEKLKGYGVFLYKGFVLGGFKANSGKANNLYPKFLRN